MPLPQRAGKFDRVQVVLRRRSKKDDRCKKERRGNESRYNKLCPLDFLAAEEELVVPRLAMDICLG